MVGILHLSDLHITSENDEIMYMYDDIYNSIKEELSKITNLIIVISGDIAYKGDSSEYNNAYSFIEELKVKTGKNAIVLMVPGNHDCDFTNSNLRDQIISIILEDKNKISTEFIDICCNVQKEFFKFNERIENEDTETLFDDKLLKIKKINIDSEKLYFVLINTAWISMINEKPGAIYFPIDKYIEKIKKYKDGTIFTVFHHPSKWQHPDDSNNFDRAVEFNSDFILTGHEHFSDNYEKRGINSNVVYFRAHALQKEEGMFKSGFSFITIDLNEKEYMYSEYDYINSKYRIVNNPEWISYQSIVKNRKNNFIIKDEFNQFLNEIGMNLNNPKKDNLKLEDIFIYPDMEKREYKKNKVDFTTSIISSEKYFADIIDNPVIIYGDDKYGKTTLAKKIFLDYYYKGYTPIYIDVAKLKRSDLHENTRLLNSLLRNQYDIQDIEVNAIKDKIIIIVDNLDKIDSNSRARLKFIEELNSQYCRIIWLCKSILSIEDIIYEDEKKKIDMEVESFYIKKFGCALKNKLIHKWNIIGEYNAQYTDEFIKKDEEKIRQINIILGKNYIPSIPFYILIILQAFEMGNEHSFVDSSYGYYYEYLILKTLNRLSKNNGEIDAINNFLINLSSYIFETNEYDITETELMKFHDRFKVEYKIPQDIKKIYNFDIFTSLLCEENLLRKLGNKYEFKYKYIYYYYVGKYFSNNMEREDIREKVSTMIDKLYIEEYANIIVFIIYMNKHDFIFKKLLEITNNLFNKHEIIKFNKDVDFINELQVEIPQIIIENINPVEYRNEKYEKQDLIEKEYDKNVLVESTSNTEDDKFEGVRQLNLAFKCMEISGQILKNYWGSLTGEIKKDIGVGLYSVGLRSLKEIYYILDKEKESLSRVIMQSVKLKNDNYNNDLENLEKQSKKMVFLFAAYFADGMIEKIGDCVGDKNLIETYKDIEEELKYNSTKIINLAIKLQYSNSNFPFHDVENLLKENKNNVLVTFLIKHMVREYLYMYKVSKPERSKIISLIGMNPAEYNLISAKELEKK